MRAISYPYIYVLFTMLMLSCLNIHAHDIDSLKKELGLSSNEQNKADITLLLSYEYRCDSLDQKLAYINDALSIAEKSHYNNGIIKASFALGKYYDRCRNDFDKGIEWYKKSYNAAPNDSTEDKHIALQGIANCYEHKALYDTALIYYKKILLLNIDKEKKMQALGNSGVIYQNIGNYTKALDNYQQAYNLLYEDIVSSGETTTNDTLTLMGLKYQIANIYKEFPDYDRALESYNEIQKLNKDIDFIWFNVVARIGIGDVYLSTNKYDSAIVYYKNVEKLLREGGYKMATQDLSQALNRMATAYFEKKMVDSALYYAKTSLQIAQDNDIITELPKTYLTLGKIYSSKNQYAKAINHLQKCVAMTKRSGATDILSDALIILSTAYKQSGQPVKALAAYQEHVTIRDSIFSRKKLQEMTRIDMQGDFDRKLLEDSLHIAKERTNAELALQRQRLLTYGGLGGVLLLLVLSFLIYRNYNQEKRSNKLITEANIAIKEEKEVSESLLLNILPEEVADELKIKGNVDAQLFDNVTVMFTDFVDFTKVGERLSPKELVQELHTCFKAFDEIIDKYNIEKIKTIGDAYLAVAGLPIPNTNHAVDIIKAATEINSFIKERKKTLGDRGFEVRIGIHSGSVVAGIVGVKKFAYDIWGDTVNIAARMEQTSEPVE